MCYYPVGWFDGAFNAFGTYRGMHLYDNSVQSDPPGKNDGHGPGLTLSYEPFITGFKNND
jgi:hypothetical protein